MQTGGDGTELSDCNPVFSGARGNDEVTQKAAVAAAGREASLSPSLHVRVGKGGQAGLGSTWQRQGRKLWLLSKRLALETAVLLTVALAAQERKRRMGGHHPSIAILILQGYSPVLPGQGPGLWWEWIWLVHGWVDIWLVELGSLHVVVHGPNQPALNGMSCGRSTRDLLCEMSQIPWGI